MGEQKVDTATPENQKREARTTAPIPLHAPRQPIETTRIGPYVLGKTLGVGSTGTS